MSDFNSEFEDQNVAGPNIMQIILRDYLPYWPVILAAAIIGYLSGILSINKLLKLTFRSLVSSTEYNLS